MGEFSIHPRNLFVHLRKSLSHRNHAPDAWRRWGTRRFSVEFAHILKRDVGYPLWLRLRGVGMAYLLPADYVNYGLPSGTTPDWITAATALINAYCRRPDLNVIQYQERLRVVSGSQTVLLSYLPLAPLGRLHRRWWRCRASMGGRGVGSCRK
jgi:hypothetical protein